MTIYIFICYVEGMGSEVGVGGVGREQVGEGVEGDGLGAA